MSTYGVPGDPPFSVLKTATRTLTNSQINSLNSTPQNLVAAPGAGIVIIPLTISACLNYSSTFNTTVEVPKRIEIQMGSSNPLWKTSIIDAEQTGDRLATGILGWVGNSGALSAYANQGIDISAGAAYTGGAGSTITFTCLYYELTC